MSRDARTAESEIISTELIEYLRSKWRQQQEKRRAVVTTRPRMILSASEEEVKGDDFAGPAAAIEMYRRSKSQAVPTQTAMTRRTNGSFQALRR